MGETGQLQFSFMHFSYPYLLHQNTLQIKISPVNALVSLWQDKHPIICSGSCSLFSLSLPYRLCDVLVPFFASVLLRWLRCCSSVWQPSHFWGIPWVWRGASIRFSPNLFKPSGLNGRQSVRRGDGSGQRWRIWVSQGKTTFLHDKIMLGYLCFYMENTFCRWLVSSKCPWFVCLKDKNNLDIKLNLAPQRKECVWSF